jgi:hypothetical protein
METHGAKFMQNQPPRNLSLCLAAALLVLNIGCGQESPSAGAAAAIKKMPAGKNVSGFLKDYSKLKSNPNLEGNALVYVNADAEKNLHKYIAVIIDPVDVYLSSDADDAKVPPKARAAISKYFHKSLNDAVTSAFPVVDQPGPLVLRLRAAVIGVDAGREIAAADRPENADDALDRTINIDKVTLEMELIDSVTGEQIAAVVDRENLGAGAEVGAVNFSRLEKWEEARDAFDGWAHRLRVFLDASHELSEEDAKRADQSYQPYGSGAAAP